MTFTYDRLGRQKTITDYVGNRTFTYNSNNLQLDTETITGFYNKTITRTYETTGVPGRNTGFTLGTDYSVNYGYDSNTGRFQSINWNVNNVTGSVNYSYGPSSDLLNGYTTPNGFQVNYGYESNRNLRTQVQNKYNNQVISEYNYVHDALGRKTSMQTTGTAPWGTPNLQVENKTYTTNNLNQYNEINKNPGPVTTNLSFDFDGNMASTTDSSGVTQYEYNAENQLITVAPSVPVAGSKKVEFAYDYIGRRVQEKVYEYIASDWQLVTENLFIYDGFNEINEQISVNNLPATIKSYIWGLDISQSSQGAGGIGGLIASIQNGATYLYCFDGNGNVGQLISSSDGSIVAHYEYDPYGNIIVESGPLAKENTFCYSTRYKDLESNLLYCGYRYYYSQFGRWINRDPVEEFGNIILRNQTNCCNSSEMIDLIELNIYTYSANDPINWIDPMGLTRRPVPGAIRGYDRGATGSITGKAGGAYNTDRWDSRGYHPHAGVDLLAPAGASVYSPINGTITQIEREAIWICKSNGTVCCSMGEGKSRSYKKQICWRLVHVTPMPYLYPRTKVYENYSDVIGTVNGWPNNPNIRPHVHIEIYEDTCILGRFAPLVRRDPTPDIPPNGRADEEE